MITARAFAGKAYAVVGLARSGLASVEALLASGARVLAWDDRPEAREAAAQLGAEVAPLDAGNLAGLDGLVLSPGIDPSRNEAASAARSAGVPLIGDIELFALARRGLAAHKVVGITGTNGKSTVTALLAHLLKSAGLPVAAGGNIGLPILAQDSLPVGGIYVLELSSYQLDLTQSLDCDVAILTTLTPDHLDRYGGSMEAYAASKLRLFAMQAEAERARGKRLALFGADDMGAAELAATVPDAIKAGIESLATYEPATFGSADEWPGLAGPHNLANAALAVEAALFLGAPPEAIRRGLASYTALPHRMERVGDVGGVAFVNDSKATNPDAAAPAIAAYPRGADGPRLHWILGGRAKGDDLGACAAVFDNVAHAYVVGEAAETFAAALERGGVAVTRCGTLDRAVEAAALAARPGDVVLLSPAAASFDQFRDFEARGDAFRGLVAQLSQGGKGR